MHPDHVVALYRHQEHELEVRLERLRTHHENSGQLAARTPRRHLMHRHPERPRR